MNKVSIISRGVMMTCCCLLSSWDSFSLTHMSCKSKLITYSLSLSLLVLVDSTWKQVVTGTLGCSCPTVPPMIFCWAAAVGNEAPHSKNDTYSGSLASPGRSCHLMIPLFTFPSVVSVIWKGFAPKVTESHVYHYKNKKQPNTVKCIDVITSSFWGSSPLLTPPEDPGPPSLPILQ